MDRLWTVMCILSLHSSLNVIEEIISGLFFCCCFLTQTLRNFASCRESRSVWVRRNVLSPDLSVCHLPLDVMYQTYWGKICKLSAECFEFVVCVLAIIPSTKPQGQLNYQLKYRAPDYWHVRIEEAFKLW